VSACSPCGPLTPDWSEAVEEKLGFLTDKLVAWDGSSQRRALRIVPRRNVSFSAPMTKAEKQYVENQLFAWGALIWALPIWWDGQHLMTAVAPGSLSVPCNTDDRDFVAGGLAILLLDALTYEVLQIESFTSSALTLSRVTVQDWRRGCSRPAGSRARRETTRRCSRIFRSSSRARGRRRPAFRSTAVRMSSRIRRTPMRLRREHTIGTHSRSIRRPAISP